jgi:hypothetical protein
MIPHLVFGAIGPVGGFIASRRKMRALEALAAGIRS